MKRRKDPAGAQGKPNESETMSLYLFTFEMVKQYPSVRSYIVKQPLRRSFKESLSELLGGGKI